MRVVNQQVPTPFRDIDARDPAAAEPPRVRQQGRAAAAPLARGSRGRSRASSGASRAMDVVLGLAEGLPSGLYTGAGHRALRARRALGPRPQRRLPRARARALPDRDRPRHLRAGRVRRRRLGRRADLDRRARLDGAADGLRARPRPRPRARSTAASSRRRTSTSRSRRARSSSSSSTRSCPFVNDFSKSVGTLFGSRPRRVCDMGFPQIGYQAFKLLAYQRLHEMARTLGGALPGRRHHADRARARRRADVPDVDHELRLARGDRPPRLRVGDAEARRGLRRPQGGLRAPRHRDLGHARAQGRQALRRASGEEPRAPGARSSSRRPARCCASPRPTNAAAQRAPGRAIPRALCSSARSRRSVRGAAASAMRTCCGVAERAAGGDEDARARSRRAASSAPSRPWARSQTKLAWLGGRRRSRARAARRPGARRSTATPRTRRATSSAQRAQRLQRAGLRPAR